MDNGFARVLAQQARFQPTQENHDVAAWELSFLSKSENHAPPTGWKS
jgi:hypothetical protein